MSQNTGKFYTNYSFEYSNENVRVATSSFQDVPTNKENLINLTMNGILRPSETLHVIKMKFKGNIPQKDRCAQSYGTFVLCKGVYNSRKVIKTAWDKETATLFVTIDLRPYNIRLKRPTQFSFTIQINDDCLLTCKQVFDNYGPSPSRVNFPKCSKTLCKYTRKGCKNCYKCRDAFCRYGYCYGDCINSIAN